LTHTELTYCVEHPDTCENEGKCVSLSREDGSYRCQCRQGFLGKNCEIRDDFLLTSVAPPRITPPTPTDQDQDKDQDVDTGVLDDSAMGGGSVVAAGQVEKLPAVNEPERRTNDTAVMVATAGAGADAGAGPTNRTTAVATGAGSHNATNEALRVVTTRRATPAPSVSPATAATSGEKAVKDNATSVAAEAGPPPVPRPLPTITSQEQTIATLAPAATATANPAATAATSVTSHKDKPNVEDEEEDEDDEDDEEDEDGEYDEEEDEDEDDEEDDSDQLIPNII